MFEKERMNRVLLDTNLLVYAIDERIQSDEYLTLVRKAFRTWNDADTEEKRKYVKNIVTNTA